jgi:hypothetical protein
MIGLSEKRVSQMSIPQSECSEDIAFPDKLKFSERLKLLSPE